MLSIFFQDLADQIELSTVMQTACMSRPLQVKLHRNIGNLVLNVPVLDFNKNVRKLIKRVDALETRMIPTYPSMMLRGRLQNFPSPSPQFSHGNHLVQPGLLTASSHHQSRLSHVEDELYQTKQWLKHRTLNLS